jgi:hypothetical protein
MKDKFSTEGKTMNKCNRCQKTFKDEDMAVIYKAEYAGGKSWGYDVSPCCLSMNYEELEQVA